MATNAMTPGNSVKRNLADISASASASITLIDHLHVGRGES
jgi:hypothetical protein